MSPKGSVGESIFYKENKTPEEAKIFWKMFLREFGARVEEIEVDGKKIKRLVFEKSVNAAGFVFPEIPDEPIIYADENGNVWNQRFSFEYAIFEKEAIFYQSLFEGIISFSYATFRGRAYYLNEIIRDNPLLGVIGEIITSNMARNGNPDKEISIGAVFDEADFLDIAIFENTIFESNVSFFKAKFRNGALFNGSRFMRELAIFSDAKFFSFKDEEILDRMSSVTTSVNPIEIVLYSELGIGASFNGSEFKAEVMFDRTAFTGASFMGAHFLRESTFDDANFNGPTIFISSVFLEDASFRKAIFDGEVTFSGSSLDWVQNLKPKLPTHEKISMSPGMFYGFVTFTEAEFNSVVNFSKCHFKKGADFGNIKFKADVDFQRSVFMEKNLSVISSNYQLPETTFAHSAFKYVAAFDFAEFGKVFFNFATFEKGASFKNATFYDEAWFKEVEFKKAVEFQAAEFNGKTTFDGSVFERVAVFVNEKRTLDEPTPKFHDELSFANCDFRQGADFLGSLKHETNLSKLWEFFSSRFSNSQAMIEALRVQRLSFEKEGKRDEADRMFVLEMHARRRLRLEQAKDDLWNSIKAKTRNFFEWLLGDLPSEYGTNWQKILRNTIIIVILFGLIYWLTILNNTLGIIVTLYILSYLLAYGILATYDSSTQRANIEQNPFIMTTFIIWPLMFLFYILTNLYLIPRESIASASIRIGMSP